MLRVDQFPRPEDFVGVLVEYPLATDQDHIALGVSLVHGLAHTVANAAKPNEGHIAH